ncbi:MAG: hypothetical protein IJ736_15335 [Firmicutes bacterium]|nr:hypothetical protein [Bacillota bacterium]
MKFTGIAKIEKLVAEYNIWELKNCPYGKFKIKIYKSSEGVFNGYTDIQIADELNNYYCAVGNGKTEEEALKNTLEHYFELISIKKQWNENDFNYLDFTEF